MQGVFPFTCPHCAERSNIQIRGDRPHLVSCTGSQCKKLLVIEPRTYEDEGAFYFSLLIRRVEHVEKKAG